MRVPTDALNPQLYDRKGEWIVIVNRCVEQGIYVTLILSLEKGHRPLRSTELSDILSVSDSYLKKILRKLVLGGVVASCPGKDGGFQLTRSLEDLSVFDIYAALEGEKCELKLSGLGHRIFIDDEKFMRGEEVVVSAFERANEAFCGQLRQMRLSELVSREKYLNGSIEFTGNAPAVHRGREE